MAMRQECRHYQSRTYASGESARFCVLDLAPEAPWRCPEDCPKYERRLADVAWSYGSLVPPPVEDEPDPQAATETASLLDEAENVVNMAVDAALADKEAQGRKRGFFRRRAN